jgi:hypothetical protein
MLTLGSLEPLSRRTQRTCASSILESWMTNKQMQRTALSDFRHLRGTLGSRLSRLGQNWSSKINPALLNGSTDALAVSIMPNAPTPPSSFPQAAGASIPVLQPNRFLGSSTKMSSTDLVNRDRSDCRGLDAAHSECTQRLSPPCIAWGTPSCGRSVEGAPLAAVSQRLAGMSRQAGDRNKSNHESSRVLGRSEGYPWSP